MSVFAMYRAVTAGGMPAGNLASLALCAPALFFPRTHERGNALFSKLFAVLVEVLRLAAQFKIGDVVVELIAVLVVHTHAAWDWPMRQLPIELRQELPPIRFGDLYKGSFFAPALVPGSNPNRSYRESIVRWLSLDELPGNQVLHLLYFITKLRSRQS